MPLLENVAYVPCPNCRRPVPLKSLCADKLCTACHVMLCPALPTELRPPKHPPQEWAGG